MGQDVDVEGANDLFIGTLEEMFARDDTGVVDQDRYGANFSFYSFGSIVNRLATSQVHLVRVDLIFAHTQQAGRLFISCDRFPLRTFYLLHTCMQRFRNE